MPFLPLFGHAPLRDRLIASLQKNALPQSMLLHGAAGLGKQRLALWLGQTLLCEAPTAEGPCDRCRHCRYCHEGNHPDLVWVFPRPRLKDSDASPEEVKNDLAAGVAERVADHGLYAPPEGSSGIYVASIRMVVRQASVTPALAKRKVIIVGDAERMVSQEGADQAANAFLKLLEEPPANTWVLLTSSQPAALLPTIRSRVIAVRVPPLSDAEVSAWLAQEQVQKALAKSGLPPSVEARTKIAAGVPGRLLVSTRDAKAEDNAKLLLAALDSSDAGKHAKTALAQGVAGARGSYSDILDALTDALRGRMNSAAAEGHTAAAERAARAILKVEDAKRSAGGNVNPQLITSALLAELTNS